MKLKYYWVTTLGLLFFLTVLDHTVNTVMYRYGLVFSWDWFFVYGLAMFMIWVFAGLRGGFLYYFNSVEEKMQKLKVSVAIVVTDISIWVCGYLDFIYFMLDGAFPAVDKVWWWMPQSRLIGGYGVVHHAVWVACWTVLLVVLWFGVVPVREESKLTVLTQLLGGNTYE